MHKCPKIWLLGKDSERVKVKMTEATLAKKQMSVAACVDMLIIIRPKQKQATISVLFDTILHIIILGLRTDIDTLSNIQYK